MTAGELIAELRKYDPSCQVTYDVRVPTPSGEGGVGGPVMDARQPVGRKNTVTLFDRELPPPAEIRGAKPHNPKEAT